MAQHLIHIQKRLVCISGAVLLAFAASTAHADVFGGSDDKAVKELTGRLSAIEAKLESLKTAPPAAPSGPAPVADGGAPVAPPEVKRAQDLDILAEPPYEVLGTLNGMHLVRKGEKRILLTAAELKAFEAEELVKARKRMEIGGGDAAAAGLKLPSPPPPPPVSANVGKDNKAIKQAEAAAAKPQAPKPAKYAASASNKPAKGGESVKK